MTKAELRSRVKNALIRIDKTAKYHNNVVDRAIESVINQVYGDLFKNNPGDLDDYTITVGDGGTPIAVSQNANSLIYYSTLPNVIAPINDKASGVRHIYTVEEGETTFVPMSKREIDLAPNTYFGTLSDKIGYAVRRDRVEYYGMTIAIATAGVRMDLLIPFTEFDEDDIIMLPFGQDAKIEELVLVFLRAIQDVDLADDNRDSKTD